VYCIYTPHVGSLGGNIFIKIKHESIALHFGQKLHIGRDLGMLW